MNEFKENPFYALLAVALSAGINVYMYTKFASYDYVNQQLVTMRTQIEKQQDEIKTNTKSEMRDVKQDIKNELTDIKQSVKALEKTTMDLFKEMKFKEGRLK